MAAGRSSRTKCKLVKLSAAHSKISSVAVPFGTCLNPPHSVVTCSYKVHIFSSLEGHNIYLLPAKETIELSNSVPKDNQFHITVNRAHFDWQQTINGEGTKGEAYSSTGRGINSFHP